MSLSSPTGPPPVGSIPVGVRATYAAFAGSGLAFASWASRIPQVRSHLHLSPAELGLVLLSVAGGSLLALPLSGPVVHRYGAGPTVRATAILLSVGLVVAAIGYRAGVAPLSVGLFVLGFANGAWDVAMNVHGAVVERQLGRSVMSRFHAGYSVGTVAGAVLGVLMVALSVPVAVHLTVVAVGVGTVVSWQAGAFLPDDATLPMPQPTGRRRSFDAWREPRTLLVGLFVLAFAFAEGAANDWISVAVIDGHRAPAAVGTLAFATFLAAMTLARWFGSAGLDRHGRVPVLRGLSLVGVAGSLLFVFGPVLPLTFVGAALWGVGVSLGFPVGMSAGADDPRSAAGRVSVIASIGYCAFLAGPPLVGLLGDRFTVLRALTAVAVLLAAAAGLAPALAATASTGRQPVTGDVGVAAD